MAVGHSVHGWEDGYEWENRSSCVMWSYQYGLEGATCTHARKNFVTVSGQRKIGEIIM